MIVRGIVSTIEGNKARLVLIDYNDLVTKFITVSKDIDAIAINDIVIAFFNDKYFSDGAIVARITGKENTTDYNELLNKPVSTIYDIDVAVDNSHVHENRNLLDTITQTLVTAWSSAYVHISDTIKHIKSTERTLWNTVTDKVDKVTGKQLSTEDYITSEKTKLAGIETGAEVNNISDVNAALLTGSANIILHYHSTDRNRANHTGMQTASTISDFDTEVTNNTEVSANTASRHSHSNKSILDGIIQTVVDSWNSAVTHISDNVKHITSAERTLWNTVTDKVIKNADITGSTKAKITYDSKGLVTGGADLIASDIPNLSWSKITAGKPTTISGYGITDAYTKSEVDNKVSAVYKYKGSVTTYSSLPSSGQVGGDVYNVTDTGINYAWEGTVWDDIGGVEALATLINNGLMTKEDFNKLAGITTGATKNDTDANLRNRTNHTGTQTASTISDFVATVRGTVLSGLSVVANTAIVATDTILVALGKLQAQVSLKAPSASPTFTGIPNAPTATTGTNTQQIATAAFVQSTVSQQITVGATKPLQGFWYKTI